MVQTPLPWLVQAFAKKTSTVPQKGTLFGSRSLRVEGICDGDDGVQWNARVEWQGDRQMAYAGVNLEGKAYDGWPVGRLIERELREQRLLTSRQEVVNAR